MFDCGEIISTLTWEPSLFICGTPRQMDYYLLPQDTSCSKGGPFDKQPSHKVSMKVVALFPKDILPHRGLLGREQAMIRKSITAEEGRSEQCSLSTRKEQAKNETGKGLSQTNPLDTDLLLQMLLLSYLFSPAASVSPLRVQDPGTRRCRDHMQAA